MIEGGLTRNFRGEPRVVAANKSALHEKPPRRYLLWLGAAQIMVLLLPGSAWQEVWCHHHTLLEAPKATPEQSHTTF